MTMPCTSCGRPLDDDAYRCPECGTLAPLPPVDDARYPRTVFDQAAPTAATGTSEQGDDTAAIPWAIPIRESRATGGDRRDPMRAAMIAVLVVAVVAGTIVVAGSLLSGGSGADATPSAADATTSSTATTVTDAGGDRSSPPTTTTAPPTTTSSTTAPSTTTSTAPPAPTTVPTTVAPATGAGAGDATVLPASFGGGWIAQLTSVPASAGADMVEQEWRRSRADAPDAVVTQSDDWTSMSPGYWVVLDAGPFASADAVRSFCASIGHADSSDCLARQLTGRR